MSSEQRKIRTYKQPSAVILGEDLYNACRVAGEYTAYIQPATYGPEFWYASDPWDPVPVDKEIQEKLIERFAGYLPKPLPPNSKLTEYGEIGVRKEGIHQRFSLSVMEKMEGPEELKGYPWPDWSSPWRWTGLREQTDDSREKGFLIGGTLPGGCGFQRALSLRGYEQLMVDFLTDSAFATELVIKLTEMEIYKCRKLAELGVDFISLEDDVGSAHGLMVSPEIWRKWLKPGIAAMMEAARQINPHIFGAYHSDGDISAIIPDLIEMGIRQINPVEPEISNMDPEKLKKQYGSNLGLYGTICTRTLVHGHPEDVRKEVTERMKTAKGYGGMILMPCNRPVELPFENLAVYLETAEKECLV